jgi:hypothetical protein
MRKQHAENQLTGRIVREHDKQAGESKPPQALNYCVVPTTAFVILEQKMQVCDVTVVHAQLVPELIAQNLHVFVHKILIFNLEELDELAGKKFQSTDCVIMQFLQLIVWDPGNVRTKWIELVPLSTEQKEVEQRNCTRAIELCVRRQTIHNCP